MHRNESRIADFSELLDTMEESPKLTRRILIVRSIRDERSVTMDNLNSAAEFRPRSRTLMMGSVPWLPRITDKARATLRGTIGDYIYP
jgi:hypothetical protein|tara:strand:- start:598 stop:861 length:264 start_codon:yes stop_codon:yes gene_type:complete